LSETVQVIVKFSLLNLHAR